MGLKFEELELLARQAGFTADVAPTMAAIAMAESSGNPRAHNATYPDNSYGLMQVNMLDEPGYELGAERRARYGLQSNEELFDPLTNLKAAKDIYETQGPDAWSVYKSGAYKQYLPESFRPLDGQQRSSAAPATQRLAGKALGSEGPLAIAIGNIANELGLGQGGTGRMAGTKKLTKSQPQVQAMAPSGEGISITELGKSLQELGFKVAENPAFGGVGTHSPNSHHYAGNAIDITIQPGSPLLAGRPDSDWRELTAQYGEQLRQRYPGAEIFHPGYDPVGGHSEHIHLAFPGGRYSRG